MTELSLDTTITLDLVGQHQVSHLHQALLYESARGFALVFALHPEAEGKGLLLAIPREGLQHLVESGQQLLDATAGMQPLPKTDH